MRITFRWFFSSCLIRTADRHLYGHNLRCLWLFFALFQYSASTHCAFISYGSDSQRELNIMPTAKYINKFIFALNKRMYNVEVRTYSIYVVAFHQMILSWNQNIIFHLVRIFIGSIMTCHKRKHNLELFFYLHSLNRCATEV